MHREDTTLIADPELLHLHASPLLAQLQLQVRIEKGITATTLPHIPLHSTGAIHLSLDGFGTRSTLTTHIDGIPVFCDWSGISTPPDFSPVNPTLWHHKVQHELPFSTVSRRVQTC
jgi:hypothetical protein